MESNNNSQKKQAQKQPEKQMRQPVKQASPQPQKQSQNLPVKRSDANVATTKSPKKKISLADKIMLKSKRFFSQFGAAVIAVAIVAYVFLQLMLNVGTLLDTEAATYVNIAARSEVSAFLFRDEEVIPAAQKGTHCYLTEDGTKVRLNEEIAIVYSNPEDVKKQQRIQEIDKRIEVLEKSSLSTGASTTSISVLDKQINELNLSILRQADSKEYDKILREKEELLILMNRRQAIIQAEDYTNELKSLSAERIILNGTLSGASYTATSPKSGYFYSTVDGYENQFTLERLENLTADDFEKLSEAVPDQSILKNSSGKIVMGSRWYIALSLDKRTAEGFVDGRSYPIVFQYSNNAEVQMKVERRIVRSDKNVAILIFSTNTLPRGFDYSRCQTVEIPCANYEGLRVSTTAIRVNDGVTGVYTVVGTKIVFKPTDVLYTYGSYSVCTIPRDPLYPDKDNISYSSPTQLSLHDSVVVDGKEIYDGMSIK